MLRCFFVCARFGTVPFAHLQRVEANVHEYAATATVAGMVGGTQLECRTCKREGVVEQPRLLQAGRLWCCPTHAPVAQRCKWVAKRSATESALRGRLTWPIDAAKGLVVVNRS